MVCVACHHDGYDAVPDCIEPIAARPLAGQADVADAFGVLSFVLPVPRRLGALLDHEQHLDDHPAVAYQPSHGDQVKDQYSQVSLSSLISQLMLAYCFR